MIAVPSKANLSLSRRRLLEVMQSINFGRIENLALHNGEPLFDPPPNTVREIKFGGDNGPRPESFQSDFKLKSQVVELFHYFDHLGSGVIESLEVKHGLPFRMMVAEPAA